MRRSLASRMTVRTNHRSPSIPTLRSWSISTGQRMSLSNSSNSQRLYLETLKKKTTLRQRAVKIYLRPTRWMSKSNLKTLTRSIWIIPSHNSPDPPLSMIWSWISFTKEKTRLLGLIPSVVKSSTLFSCPWPICNGYPSPIPCAKKMAVERTCILLPYLWQCCGSGCTQESLFGSHLIWQLLLTGTLMCYLWCFTRSVLQWETTRKK